MASNTLRLKQAMSPPPDSVSIPMNDLRRLYHAHRNAIDAAVLETLDSGWWLNGPRGAAFAEAFSRYLGVSECVLVANGTDAIEIALRTILAGRTPSDLEVVTVANAGGYTTTACRQVGLVPVYADVDEKTLLMSAEAATAALSANSMAVVATHLFGNVTDIKTLRSSMDNAGYSHVPIVEDCAQAHGARFGAALAGTMGDLATFSFYPTKNLGARADGGALVTSNKTFADTARRLQQYGWAAKYEIVDPGGRNSRMDEIQAAILATLLPYHEETDAERNRIGNLYEAAARSSCRFATRKEGSLFLLAIALCDERDALRKFLAARGIFSDIHYPVLDPDQPGWLGLPGRE